MDMMNTKTDRNPHTQTHTPILPIGGISHNNLLLKRNTLKQRSLFSLNLVNQYLQQSGGKHFGQNSLFLPPTFSLFLPRFLVLNNRKPLFLTRFRILAYFFYPLPLQARYWPKYLPLGKYFKVKYDPDMIHSRQDHFYQKFALSAKIPF